LSALLPIQIEPRILNDLFEGGTAENLPLHLLDLEVLAHPLTHIIHRHTLPLAFIQVQRTNHVLKTAAVEHILLEISELQSKALVKRVFGNGALGVLPLRHLNDCR